MEANKVKQGSMGASRTRSIAFVALTIALLGVSAWVSIPIGPVMLTLQMFAVMFAIMVLTPKQCMASIAGYLALGAIGLPMFSGMRGGIAMLMGPTGGYLWGFLLAAAVALLVREGLRRAIGEKGVSGPMAIVVDMVACLAFIIVTYVCGCFQYAAVVGVDLAAASPPARCCWKRKSASEHGRGMRYRPRPSAIDHQTKRASEGARFVW